LSSAPPAPRRPPPPPPPAGRDPRRPLRGPAGKRSSSDATLVVTHEPFGRSRRIRRASPSPWFLSGDGWRRDGEWLSFGDRWPVGGYGRRVGDGAGRRGRRREVAAT